jgi:hypothetical protein
MVWVFSSFRFNSPIVLLLPNWVSVYDVQTETLFLRL